MNVQQATGSRAYASLRRPWLLLRLLHRTNLSVACIARGHSCRPLPSRLSFAYGLGLSVVWAFGDVNRTAFVRQEAPVFPPLEIKRYDKIIIIPKIARPLERDS